MTNYQIYTDGSCRANGNGGIGVVWIKNGEKVFEYSKGYVKVTNNIMELKAIGIALTSIKKQLKRTQSLVKEPIKYRHIDGHQRGESDDIKWNNLCDKLATNESSMII